jgi:hypothetical protein
LRRIDIPGEPRIQEFPGLRTKMDEENLTTDHTDTNKDDNVWGMYLFSLKKALGTVIMGENNAKN